MAGSTLHQMLIKMGLSAVLIWCTGQEIKLCCTGLVASSSHERIWGEVRRIIPCRRAFLIPLFRPGSVQCRFMSVLIPRRRKLLNFHQFVPLVTKATVQKNREAEVGKERSF